MVLLCPNNKAWWDMAELCFVGWNVTSLIGDSSFKQMAECVLSPITFYRIPWTSVTWKMFHHMANWMVRSLYGKLLLTVFPVYSSDMVYTLFICMLEYIIVCNLAHSEWAYKSYYLILNWCNNVWFLWSKLYSWTALHVDSQAEPLYIFR